MNVVTTNIEELNAAIEESGLPITKIARRLGVTREGFYKKKNGETEFKASEIAKLTKILGLTKARRDKIFFI